MAAENSFFVKKFEKCEHFYVVYAKATKMPFIECDEETFDDQVLIYLKEEDIKSYIEKRAEEKYVLGIGTVPGAQIKRFVGGLYGIGVNSLLVHGEGAPIRIALEEILPPPNMEELKKNPIPQLNPEVQLTALYFMQELRRPVERTIEEKKALRQMEEEMAVNLMRSHFIMGLDITETGPIQPGKEGKVKIPYVKTTKGDVLQPCYTDIGEFRKFNAKNKDMKLQLVTVTYDNLIKNLVGESKGFAINPAGFNLVLTKTQLEQMKQNYGEK